MKNKTITTLIITLTLLLLLTACNSQTEVNETLDNTTIEVVTVTPEVTPTKEAIEEPEEVIEEEPSLDIIPDDYWYSLTVKINPYVELYFDKNDIINGIAYLNEDAIDAYSNEEIIGKSRDEGVQQLVSLAIDKGYIKDEPSVEVELCKLSDTAKDSIDTSVLVEVSAAINEIFQVPEENDTEVQSKAPSVVDMKVSKEVEDATGLVAPSVCPDCNGTGNSCKECNGEGIVNCKHCSGGNESCGTCHGSAIINCHSCGGKGGDCGRCNGTGKIACDQCGGQGSFNCSWCKGALRHICPECWGEGTCETCGGIGIIYKPSILTIICALFRQYHSLA